jgi:23S rRNA pseudouridine1911/1915/1917 synthase
MEKEKISLLYQNENLLVVNKPAGLVVYQAEGESLIQNLLKADSSLEKVGKPPRYGLIHRLDKETSGLLLIARNNPALAFFQKQFQEREVEKKYLALVWGHFQLKEGIIKAPIGRSKKDFRKQKVFFPTDPHSSSAKPAITLYKVLQEFNQFSLLELSLKTGRRHQLRVHLAWKKHPVVGDQQYGFKNQFKLKYLKHHFLHSFYLKIHLMNGEEKEFFSPLPVQLKKVLTCLPLTP